MHQIRHRRLPAAYGLNLRHIVFCCVPMLIPVNRVDPFKHRNKLHGKNNLDAHTLCVQTKIQSRNKVLKDFCARRTIAATKQRRIDFFKWVFENRCQFIQREQTQNLFIYVTNGVQVIRKKNESVLCAFHSQISKECSIVNEKKNVKDFFFFFAKHTPER